MIESSVKPRSLKLNFVLNTTRTILNFLVPLVIFPYVSRVLGPDGLGKVEFANSIVSYFVLFTALGIPTYGAREIARVRDDLELRSKTVWEFILIMLFTILIGYVFYFILLGIIPRFAEQRLLFLIVAPTIFLSDFSFEWFYQGIEDQSYITIRYLIVKIIQVTCVFLLIKEQAHFLRYAAITVGLNSISTIFNMVHLRKYVKFYSLSSLDIKRHIKSIFVVFTAVCAVSVYMHLDITMLGFFSGEEKVGFYTAANRLVRVVILFVTALSVVIAPRLDNCYKKGDMIAHDHYLNLSVNYILILAVPCFLGINILIQDIMLIFAGAKYSSAVLTARILSPMIIIVSLAYFIGMQIIYTRRKEWQYTVSVSVSAIINALLNAILIPQLAHNGAAIGTLAAESIGLFIQVCFAWQYLIKTDLFSLNTIKFFIAGIVMSVAIIFIPYINGSVFLHFIISVLSGAVIYGLLLLILHEKMFFYILSLLLKIDTQRLQIRYNDFIKTLFFKAKKDKRILVHPVLNPNNEKTYVYLAVCAIIKNEGRYLQEWIEFHLLQGVDVFYLYDNESSDNTKVILEPYIQKGIVKYHITPGKKMQRPAYNDAIVRYRKEARWIAFIDADEFILPHEIKLSAFLKDYEKYPGIGINWQMFDSNGRQKYSSEQLVIEAYTQIHKDKNVDNLHIKTIVNPSKVKFYVNPHYPLYKFFQHSVDEDQQVIHEAWTKEQKIQKIQINHYFSKSYEEFFEKIQRGMADTGNKRKLEAELKRVSFTDPKIDDSMKRFVPIMKNILKKWN